MPNSHNLKIQYGGGRYLEFQENINNSGFDRVSNLWGRCTTAMQMWNMTKKRNRKLI